MAVNEKASVQAIESLREQHTAAGKILTKIRELSYIDSLSPRMNSKTKATFLESAKTTLTEAGVTEKELVRILKTRQSITMGIDDVALKYVKLTNYLLHNLNVQESSLDIRKVTYVRNTLLVKIKAIERSDDPQEVATLFKSAVRAIKRYDFLELDFTPETKVFTKRGFKSYKTKMISTMVSYVDDLNVELRELNSWYAQLLK